MKRVALAALALLLMGLGGGHGGVAPCRHGDRRCLSNQGFWILQNGPSAAQEGTGNPVVASNGTTLTVSRASSAYCSDSSGVLHLLSNNQPCVEPQGLRVEGSATNLALQSQALGTAPWAVAGTAPTVTNNTTDVTAPDGTNTATKVAFANNATTLVRQNFGSLSNAPYTESCYIRGASSGTLWMTFSSETSTGAGINFTTAWQRFTHTLTPAAGSNNFDLGVNTSVTGESAQPAQTVYFWGCQLEQQAFASSYIATTTTAATRAADSISVGNPLASSAPDVSVFGATVTALEGGAAAANGITVIELGTAFTNNDSWLQLSVSNTEVDFNVQNSAGVTSNNNASGTPNVFPNRVLASNQHGALTTYQGGVTRHTATETGSQNAQPATVWIGSNGGANTFSNGWLTNICLATSTAVCPP